MGRIESKVLLDMELSAVVTRADGTVEDLGVIARQKPSFWERVRCFVSR